MPSNYFGLTVRSFAEVRDDKQTRTDRNHRLNLDVTQDEYSILRRHAEAAGCSLVELVGGCVRLWLSEANLNDGKGKKKT